MADQFLLDEITATEAQIRALNTAILGLATNEVVSYSLDNGQTKETVTRRSLPSMEATKIHLMNYRKQLRINAGLEASSTILRQAR